MNTAIGCGILIDILRKSQSDDGKSTAAECLARLAHLKSGKYSSRVLAFLFLFDYYQFTLIKYRTKKKHHI